MAGSGRHGGDDANGRERLLAAGVRLFARKGYAGTTVRDLLREARVTAPVLYYHFSNKEGLFLAIADAVRKGLDEVLRRAREQEGTAAERIRAYCRALAEIRLEHAGLIWAVEGILSGPAEEAPGLDVETVSRQIARDLACLVEAGIESGEFRRVDAELTALVFQGAVEMTARKRRRPIDPRALGTLLDGMLAVILSGLETHASADARADGGD